MRANMLIDHFDGKSLARRSIHWLREALADAERKALDCATAQQSNGGTEPHSAAMWRGIADRYRSEIVARESPVSARRTR